METSYTDKLFQNIFATQEAQPSLKLWRLKAEVKESIAIRIEYIFIPAGHCVM